MREDIARLEDSVGRLLKRYAEARAEAEKLRGKLAEQQEREEGIRKELEYWKWEAQGKALGEALEDQGARKALRIQLDQLIAEIDKVLAKIHE